jgi:hypothetical protein
MDSVEERGMNAGTEELTNMGHAILWRPLHN